jgi:hypothetical protein
MAVVIAVCRGNPVIMLLLSHRSSLGLGLCLRMLMVGLVSMLLLVMALLMMCPGSIRLRILMLVRENVIGREHRCLEMNSQVT